MSMAAPSTNPPPTGRMGLCPASRAMSIAGMSRDHTAAAVMTPAAKPRKTFCVLEDMSFRKKKTMAAPITVARQVKPVPSRV